MPYSLNYTKPIYRSIPFQNIKDKDTEYLRITRADAGEINP